MFYTLKQAREIVREQERIEMQEKKRREMEKISPDTRDNFQELVNLSNQKGSRFSIEGDHRNFIIHCKPDLLPIFLWLIVIVIAIVRLSFEISPSGLSFILLFYLAIMVIYFKLAPTTYDITVDSIQKQIMLKSSNPIGKLLHKETFIDFGEIIEISSKSISTKLKDGLNNWFFKVILHHGEKKTGIVFLPNGPFSKIDNEAFINNFSNIVHPRQGNCNR